MVHGWSLSQFTRNQLYFKIITLLTLLHYAAAGCQYIDSASDYAGLEQAKKHINLTQGQRFTLTQDTETKNIVFYVGICTTPRDPPPDGLVDKNGIFHDSNISYENIGIYQEITDKEDTSKVDYKVVGRTDKATLVSGSDWTILDYEEGQEYQHHCQLGDKKRTGRLMLQCGPTDELHGQYIMENSEKEKECYYLFEIRSKMLCPTSQASATTSGLSAGSILLIVFLSIVIAYVALGFLYQRCVKGAQGAEQFPNISFWRKFGNLIADGCDFVFRSTPSYESPQYRSTPTSDANLPSDDATIDERLLTM